ncbi:MAG: hypothetical protein CM1200mP35_07410 [Chloroflexota bacterium]|nr:MAG: hypothetical protein CM1200mP35_07410 [Chloroflexota bacterium]
MADLFVLGAGPQHQLQNDLVARMCLNWVMIFDV